MSEDNNQILKLVAFSTLNFSKSQIFQIVAFNICQVILGLSGSILMKCQRFTIFTIKARRTKTLLLLKYHLHVCIKQSNFEVYFIFSLNFVKS